MPQAGRQTPDNRGVLMNISAHKLDGVRYRPARKIGDTITPTLIVIHETAGSLNKFSTVRWFQSRKVTTSAHIVIERDGTITQMVPLNRRANHAGRSSWKGNNSANYFSIGIELVGPGALDKNGKVYFGPVFPDSVSINTPEHGNGHRWLPFTDEQMAACRQICEAIVEEYPTVNDIAGHYEISPGRKVDPAPTFPMEDFRKSIFEPTAPTEIETAEVCTHDPAKTLAATSRKYKAAGVVKGAAAAGVSVGSLMEGLSIANVQATKSYLDAITSFMSAYGVTVFICACVGGYVVFEIMQKWMRDDVEEGRYVPSGESNA